MAVSTSVLGMNARNFLYITRYNRVFAKRVADDKLETKKILAENGISTPKLLASIYDREEIRNFDWDSLPEDGFVVKPARGYGGEGILVVKRWNGRRAVTVSGDAVSQQSLESHLLNILEGAFSLQYLPDKAFIEERIVVHPFFKKLTTYGIPDIRVIVLNHVPVMAMLRIPTEESNGKANLHQGAIGVGIDMRTGITTHAISRDKPVSHIPGTKQKTRGIKLPDWDGLLYLAAKTQSVCGLGFAGIDIVFDAEQGPLVLETNARPGLSIQNANRDSLRTRLERIENMKRPTPERGVEMAKSLFAEGFSEKVEIKPRVLSVVEPIVIHHKDRMKVIKAKVDSGALRTSIDEKVVHELGLPHGNEQVLVTSASGQGYRPTVKFSYELGGKKIQSTATVADRSKLKYPMIVGRLDLKGFLIDPNKGGVEMDEIEGSNR